MNVCLRQATLEDAEFLFQLHRESFGVVVVATWGPWDDARQREFHDAWFDPARLAVIVCDRRDAGVLDVQRQDDGTVYLARVELLPEHQGRGIGTRMVQRLIDNARHDGAASVVLDVLEANEGARRLYQRLGFELVATTPPKQRMRLVI